jgi:2'-5' RNA ligase
MPRLFVALRPPADVAAALAALAGPVEGARWLRESHLHVTLQFLGHLESAAPVEAALRGVTGPPVQVDLDRRAAYPGPERARVLVAEGPPGAALVALQRRVVAALAGVRPPEARPFRPHVTLARLKTPAAAAVRAWLTGPPPVQTFEAREVVLYESRPGPQGSAYVPLAVYALGSP